MIETICIGLDDQHNDTHVDTIYLSSWMKNKKINKTNGMRNTCDGFGIGDAIFNVSM